MLQCAFPNNRDILLHNHATITPFSKFNIGIVLFPNLLSWYNFTSRLNNVLDTMCPPSLGCSKESDTPFACHISLSSFNLQHFHSFSLTFITLSVLKNTISHFDKIQCFSFCICLMFLYHSLEVCIIVKLHSWCLSLRILHLYGHLSFMGDVNFGHSIKEFPGFSTQ